MDRNQYREMRDAICRLVDMARIEEASALVAGIAWREGEPETVCTGSVNIPSGGETAAGMVALLLFSVLGRQFEHAEDRLLALDAASEFVRMLIERNPHARRFTELTDMGGDGLPDMPAPPVQ